MSRKKTVKLYTVEEKIPGEPLKVLGIYTLRNAQAFSKAWLKKLEGENPDCTSSSSKYVSYDKKTKIDTNFGPYGAHPSNMTDGPEEERPALWTLYIRPVVDDHPDQ